MNNSNDRMTIITSSISKVQNGISKGTWTCEFYTQTYPFNDGDGCYWTVKSVNSQHCIEFGYRLKCETSECYKYWFSICKDNEKLYNVFDDEINNNSPELNLIIEGMSTLINEYKKTLDLMIV